MSGWRSSPHALRLVIDRSRPRTLQQRNDIYGLENDDKMQPCISWSTSRAVPMSCTAHEMRCDAEIDIHMQVGAASDDGTDRLKKEMAPTSRGHKPRSRPMKQPRGQAKPAPIVAGSHIPQRQDSTAASKSSGAPKTSQSRRGRHLSAPIKSRASSKTGSCCATAGFMDLKSSRPAARASWRSSTPRGLTKRVVITFSEERIQIQNIYGSNDCLPPQRADASRQQA